MTSLVTSVEFINHIFDSSATTSSGLLGKGQNINNCVPFISHYGDTDYPDGHFFDVWFEDSEDGSYINFERSNSRSTALYIKAYIVEFDPSKVKVHQGLLPTSFDTSEVKGTTVSGGFYNQLHSALKFYYRTNSTSQALGDHMCRGQLPTISGTYGDAPTFSRRMSTGVTNGHYFIFESLNDDFKVYHQSGVFRDSTTIYPKGSLSYDEHNSFLLASNCIDYSNAGPSYNTMRAYLYGGAKIPINMSSGNWDCYYNLQLIEFSNEATSSGVSYAPKITMYHSLNSSTTERTITLDDWEVSEETSAIFPVQEPHRCTSTSSSDIDISFVACWLTTSGTKYNLQRASTGSDDTYPTYNIVDWAGIPPKYPDLGINITPIDPLVSPVKSIENTSYVLEEFWQPYVLTKGQNLSNCVVFRSGFCNQTSNYDQQYRNETMVSFRGNELIMERGNEGWAYNASLAVVEFYPDQVRVQQGSFLIETNQTSVSVTIDEIVKDKSFLVFSHFMADYESAWGYRSVRGQIENNTTLTFTRGLSHASPIKGSYFVVEDLTDIWEVKHIDFSRSTSGWYGYAYDDLWSEYNTFTLFSSENESLSTPPQYSCWRTYWHSQHTPAVFDGKATNYYGQLSAMIVKFLDDTKIYTHYSAQSLTGADKTNTYLLPDVWLGLENCVTVIPSCNNGTARVASTSSTANIDAFWKITYDTDTNEVTTQRNESQTSQYSSYHTIFSVCWQGAERTIEDTSYTSLGSFIKTIEHLVYVGTNRRATFTPSKGQDLRNCFPVVTWKCGETASDMERYFKSIWFLPDISYVKFESFNPTDEYGGVSVDITLIEFDPVQVRVQHGRTNLMAGSTTTTTTISGVDISKAFITSFTFCHHDVGTSPNNCQVATKFNSSTQLGFSRGNTAGSLVVSWFIVECLQDQWEVRHYSLDSRTNSTYTYINLDAPIDKNLMLPVVSLSDNCASVGPGYWTRRVYSDHNSFGQAYRMVFNKSYTNYYLETAELSVIEFNKNSGVTIIPQHFSFSGGIDSVDVILPEEVDPNRSVIWNALTTNTMRVETTSSTYLQEAFPLGAFVDSNTVNFSKSDYTDSFNAWGHAYIVQWPMPTHKIAGVVREKGTPVSRDITIHKTIDGSVLTNVTSDMVDGEYIYVTSYSGSVYLVCFDDIEGTEYNGLIETDVYATIVSGTFPYEEGWS